MAHIKILKIINKDEISKAGKSYTKCSIKTIDKNGQEVWINGFGNNTTKSWSEGQEIELDVYQEEYQGQMRLKFRDVKEISILQEISDIKQSINKILEIIQGDKTVKGLPILVSPEEMAKFEAGLDEQPTKEQIAALPF